MAILLLAIPVLIVFYIISEGSKPGVVVDPLAQVRQDETLFQSLGRTAGSPLSDPAPLYCPGCKTYEDMTIFRGDSDGRRHAIDTWYEDHKPHFLPADNQPHLPGAPGS